METIEKYRLLKNKFKFKSYYVVWKPVEEKEKLLSEARFKSYYVVWKRWVVGTERKDGGV